MPQDNSVRSSYEHLLQRVVHVHMGRQWLRTYFRFHGHGEAGWSGTVTGPGTLFAGGSGAGGSTVPPGPGTSC